MTKEEAINQLKINKEDDTYVIDDEALDMAIKALEQGACEDCVSREALLAMSDYVGESPTYSNPYAKQEEVVRVEDIKSLPPVQPIYNASEWCHDCKEYDHNKHCCPRFNKVIRNTVEEMKQQKTGHWISVSERLPKWGEGVLTIDNNGTYEINHIIDDERNKWFYDNGIVAWLPLPEPYEPQESDNTET